MRLTFARMGSRRHWPVFAERPRFGDGQHDILFEQGHARDLLEQHAHAIAEAAVEPPGVATYRHLPAPFSLSQLRTRTSPDRAPALRLAVCNSVSLHRHSARKSRRQAGFALRVAGGRT